MKPQALRQRVVTFIAVYSCILAAVRVVENGALLEAVQAQFPGGSSLEPVLQRLAGRPMGDGWDWLFAAPAKGMPKEERLALLVEENAWKNGLVMWAFPQHVRAAIPHIVQTWLRCVFLANALYLSVGAVWCWYAYVCFGDRLYGDKIPAASDIWEQIRVSLRAMPLYSVLPTLTEWAAESGLTAAYPRIDNMGLFFYLAYFVLYMASVEFGVYWCHRGLHDVRWAYKLLHFDHHKYNKEQSMSPFAGLAFNPFDGIIQAIAYSWTLCYVPMHFLTHELLLFATDLWTTNIHDCLHGNVWPIMGAGYHLIHHTMYNTNYGHYFVYMDWLHGTLETPEEHARRMAAAVAPKRRAVAAERQQAAEEQAEEQQSEKQQPAATPARAARTPTKARAAVAAAVTPLTEDEPLRRRTRAAARAVVA